MSLILFVAFVTGSLISYLLVTSLSPKLIGQWNDNQRAVADDIEAMFIRHPEKNATRVKVAVVICMMVTGFAFPSSLSGLDRVILDSAARLNKQGLYDQAILFISGLKRNQSPMLHNELGVAYLGVNDLEAAIKNFELSVKLLPEYGQARANLSTAYTLAERHTDAMFEARRAQDYLKFDIDEELIYGANSSLQASLFLRLLFAVIFLYFGLKIPKWATGFLRRRREVRYERDLADALKIMSNSLKAGMSLPQSIEMMVDQTNGPVREEFELVLKQNILSGIEDALLALRERMPIDDNVMLIDTILLLSETGGDIPSAIQNVVFSISERQRVKNKISAMTAEGKAQTVILACIPVAIAFVMNTMQKEMFSLMYTTVLGWVFLVIMIVWGAIGIYMMLKIVDVKI